MWLSVKILLFVMISLDRMETLLHYTLDEILKAPHCMADGIEF